MYTFIDAYHSLCSYKKDIVIAKLGACENFLKDNDIDDIDRNTRETEIAELKMALDLLP